MKFLFERIGPVDAAELALGDLTVIAGRNNTGKTYLAYSLYGFLRLWKGWPGARALAAPSSRTGRKPRKVAVDLRAVAKELREQRQTRLSVAPEALAEARRHLVRHLASDFSKYMPQAVFSTSADELENASINIELESRWPEAHRTQEIAVRGGGKLSMDYDGTYLLVSWTTKSERTGRSGGNAEVGGPSLLEDLCSLYVRFLCAELPDPFILSAERFGISLFYKELDFTKNQLVDLLQKLGDEKSRSRLSPFVLIDRAASRYALPIKDNIDYTRELADRTPRPAGSLADRKFYDDIKDMLDGYFRTSGKTVRFRSKARKIGKFDIPLHLASSSVRGLVDFYFFLRRNTEPNQLLIIDEPESHLDTRNQILMARLLARLVGAGLKVLITTHSDYLVKELNNLIMLSHLGSEERRRLAKTYGYRPRDLLDGGAVRAYVAEDRGLREARVDRFGMDLPVFDSTIDSINRTANHLASRVSAESTE